MKNISKKVIVSLVGLSLLGTTGCVSSKVELTELKYLSDFESSILNDDQRTIYKLEETINTTLDIATSENYIQTTGLDKYFEVEMSEANQQKINSLMSKDKRYDKAKKEWDKNVELTEDDNYTEIMGYKSTMEYLKFDMFLGSYAPSINEEGKVRKLHSQVDSYGLWAGSNGVYVPVTPGAVSILDDKDRYVSFSGAFASPIHVTKDEIKISSADVSTENYERHSYLHDEMDSIIFHLMNWSAYQSLDKNFDLNDLKDEIFANYVGTEGLSFTIDGDISSVDILVKDKKGNVLTTRNESLDSSNENYTSNRYLERKDSIVSSFQLPYELSLEYDREIAVTYQGNKKATLDEVVAKLNNNDKFTKFNWTVIDKNTNDATIVAKGSGDEWKFTDRLTIYKSKQVDNSSSENS